MTTQTTIPAPDSRYDSTVSVTYSCKHCKTVVQAVYPVRTEYKEWNDARYVTGRYAYKNDAWQTEYKFSGPGAPFATPCECGKTLTGKSIVGTANPSVSCDSRCTGAKGHTCECSCGGANHGKDHRPV